MRSKLLSLTMALLRNSDGLGIRPTTPWGRRILFGSLAVGIPAYIYATVSLVQLMYDSLLVLDQTGVLISWGLAAASLLLLLISVVHVVSSFYFSVDVENLLYLPVRPWEIVGAKFLNTLAYQYFLTTLILLPVLGVYGAKSGFSLLYVLYSLVVILLIPILPLAVGSVLVIGIMRYANVSRYKDLVKTVAGVLAIFAVFVLSALLQRFGDEITMEQLEELIAVGNNSLIAITNRMFPTAAWAANALLQPDLGHGLVNLLVFAAISLVSFGLLLWFGERLYLRGVIGLTETGSRRLSPALDLTSAAVQHRPLNTYLLTELRLLFRTPVYFLNCVLMNLVWPVIAVIAGMAGDESINLAAEWLRNEAGPGMLLSSSLALLTFLNGTNAITPTAISREGSSFFIKKYIPMDVRHQLTAKVLSGFLLGCTALVGLLLLAIGFLELSPALAASLVVLGWLPAALTSYFGLLIDLFNPKLQWDSEQRAVKQNMNVLYTMAASAMVSAAVGYGGYRLAWGLLPTALAAGGFYVGLTALCAFLVYTKGAAAFHSLEG